MAVLYAARLLAALALSITVADRLRGVADRNWLTIGLSLLQQWSRLELLFFRA
jgi:hypothetical protein